MSNWQTSDFDFDLPEDRIATSPASPRDAAKMLHVAANGTWTDRCVRDLETVLQAGDVLVTNNTRVIPARLHGVRCRATAAPLDVEILLDKPTPDVNSTSLWLALVRPGKRLRVGDIIACAPDFAATVRDKHDDGMVVLDFGCSEAALVKMLHHYGQMPLPPYISRPDGATTADSANYQTVYAEHDGAVAAPTAGLHFTPELLQRLSAAGIQQTSVTLHVGSGTFLPVRVDSLTDHVMHSERGIITPQAADMINSARRNGGRIVAVGTTSLRLLESAANEDGIIEPFSGETNIFIYPGYRFRAVDVLMTNFHLPKSTLFMLVSAFSGMENIQAAYAHAIQSGYRFYSYGDATLLEKALTAE